MSAHVEYSDGPSNDQPAFGVRHGADSAVEHHLLRAALTHALWSPLGIRFFLPGASFGLGEQIRLNKRVKRTIEDLVDI